MACSLAKMMFQELEDLEKEYLKLLQAAGDVASEKELTRQRIDQTQILLALYQ